MVEKKDLMKLQNGSDVRGIAVDGVEGEKVNLFPEAVNRIATGFVRFLEKRTNKKASELTLTVGHDSRISADMMMSEIKNAFVNSGAKTIDCDLASTPAMFMSTVFDETKADGAVMVTASHLPFNRNGMKFFTKDGGAEHEDITEILEYAYEAQEVKADISSVQKYDLLGRYSAFLCDKIKDALNNGDKPLSGMHIVVDAGNGDGGFFAYKVLDELGADTTGSQFLEPDGHFPNHIPNPENKDAMNAIRKAVLDSKADLGLIFDTDVDRMSAVLSDGEEVNRNALIGLIAAILAPDYPGSTIITDSVTSDELTEFLTNELHLKHHRFMRGYKNVINECIRMNKAGEVSPLAIETSGHGALSENYYLDDGAYLAVKLLIAAARQRKKGGDLASLIAKLKSPAESKEYRLYIRMEEGFKDYGNDVLKEFEKRAKDKGIKIASPSFEGVRLVFDNGWALLRMSLHDPNMPLNIESRNPGGLAGIENEVKGLLDGFDKLDLSAFS
ncbi:MAG: phosphomannomutase/phosphoglucomutase [Lachnospiraceae bacterium]|nr:phosphomannomutase/phosphoglucomutase [Lachnospiraceae bacterium]